MLFNEDRNQTDLHRSEPSSRPSIKINKLLTIPQTTWLQKTRSKPTSIWLSKVVIRSNCWFNPVIPKVTASIYINLKVTKTPFKYWIISLTIKL